MRKVAVVVLALAGLACIAASARYLFATEFMPYHAAVAGKAWGELEPGVQTIIIGMLKIVGAGFLGSGVALLFLLVPVLRGERWPVWASLAIGASVWLPTLYVTLLLRAASASAQPPTVPAAVILSLIAVAALLLWVTRPARSSK